MDGFETAALIRQRKRSAHTPIIFITAFADEMQTAQGYSLGAVDYILSPVVPEVLRTRCKVFVELHRDAAARARGRPTSASRWLRRGGAPRRRGERPALDLPRRGEPRAERHRSTCGRRAPALVELVVPGSRRAPAAAHRRGRCAAERGCSASRRRAAAADLLERAGGVAPPARAAARRGARSAARVELRAGRSQAAPRAAGAPAGARALHSAPPCRW